MTFFLQRINFRKREKEGVKEGEEIQKKKGGGTYKLKAT